MKFENFLEGVSNTADEAKKKIKNIAKIASIVGIGLSPMTSMAEGNANSSVEATKQEEMKKAYNEIKSDADMFMIAEKSYYLRTFPGLEEDDVDSLISLANQEVVAAMEKREAEEASKPKPEMTPEDSLNRKVGSILYPDQAEDILNGGRFIPPSKWIVEAYKAGEFNSREEYMKKRDELSEKYNQ